MKKLLALVLLALVLPFTQAFAAWFKKEDPCNPTPVCGPEPVKCYDCALNKPEVLVKLTPCAYKDKPYNYYTWTKTAEKEVSSDRYDWTAEAEATE